METKVSFEKTIREGENTKTIRVEEIENGFIICIDKYGYKGEGDKKEHYSEYKKYYSKENPLEDLKAEKEDSENVDFKSALLNFNINSAY